MPKYDFLQHALVEHMQQNMKDIREPTRALSAKGWSQARNKRVTSNDTAVYVRDYAFNHLKMYRDQVQSKKFAEQHLFSNAYGLLEVIREPDPGGIENCYPPSIAACSAVLGVPELQKYEVHLCSRGCIHWWLDMPNFQEHFRACNNPDCPDCICPHCKARRFVKDKKGIHGVERC
jgi:hypothetical protein